MELTQVILVNEHDEAMGTMEKLEAHRKGILHRAFSVFIINRKNEVLLQQRAFGKYHSAGLWTNACCSHPLPGEPVEAAAHRRLQEELGFDCVLTRLFSFTYRAVFDNGLIEHEYDHVFLGTYDEDMTPDPAEVYDHRFLSVNRIHEWMQQEPGAFTSWFHLAFPRVLQYLMTASRETL